MRVINFLKQHSVWILLGLIVSLGLWLRVKNLTFQSMWVDEIITMNYNSPSNSLGEVLSYLRPGGDPHPAYYYFTLHFWIKVFGYNDLSARLYSVFGGTVGIIAMFFLGMELRNRSTGLLAAFLTALNYFCIYYSQEARGYIFAFLFATLSFLFLIKALKDPQLKHGVWYGVFTLLLLYAHYFAFFVLASQVVIVGIFYIHNRFNPLYLKCFLLAGLIVVIGYLPWLKTLYQISQITTFWMEKPKPDFYIDFFNAYFGNQPVLVLLFAVLVLIFFASLWFSRETEKSSGIIAMTPLLFSFTVLTIWIFLSYLLPYIRSLTVIPNLGDRYTIVTLPAFLIIISIAIDLLPHKFLKAALVGFVLIVTMVSLFYEAPRYYETKAKSDWRGMIGFITENNQENYPVISDKTWFFTYYLEQFHSNSTRFWETNVMDSLQQYGGKGVWVGTGHGGKPLNETLIAYLNSNFKVVKEFSGVDAWSKLYLKPDATPRLTGANSVNADSTYILNFFGHLKSDSLQLTAGNYELIVRASGSIYKDFFPVIRLSANGIELHRSSLREELRTYIGTFSVREGEPVTVDVEYVDDPEAPTGERNMYVFSVHLNRLH